MSASCVKLRSMLKICEEFGMLCGQKLNFIRTCAGLGQRLVNNSYSNISKQYLVKCDSYI